MTTLGYIYESCRIKNPTDILRIIQRLTHLTDNRGRHRKPRYPMALPGTNTQMIPNHI